MSTKHQPATPLPWTKRYTMYTAQAVRSDGPGYTYSPSAPFILMGNAHQNADKDIGFAIHAGNAYPKLVEALRAYQTTVSYLKRTANPDEWASLGDWTTLHANAQKALHDAGEIP